MCSSDLKDQAVEGIYIAMLSGEQTGPVPILRAFTILGPGTTVYGLKLEHRQQKC